VNPDTGWFLDYDVVDRAFHPIYDALDHRYLNDVEGLENPTSEVLARWIWERLSAALPLERITVHETCDARCEYEGK
jgi:6-pyruvoyltetrahydropterin/6-carboxytetrahydropterin synthase